MLVRRAVAHPRSLHSSATLLRDRPAKRPSSFFPSSSSSSSSTNTRTRTSPSRFQGGGGRFQFHKSKQNSAPSSISTHALTDKISHHLRTVWHRNAASSTLSPPLRELANDLALHPSKLRSLAGQFAETVLATLPSRSPAKGRPSTPVDLPTPSSTSIVYDLPSLQTSYISDGPSALFDSSLRLFLRFVQTLHPLPPPRFRTPSPEPTLSKLHQLATIADLRFQASEGYPSARQQRRTLILHVGPTNSGKTYSALIALAKARTGAYAGPLRLLAHEVFSRFNEGKIGAEGNKRVCNLVTGEEQRIIDPDAGLQSCTVEMFPLTKRLDVGVIDEIQMLGDPQRGPAWTAAVVGSLCDELHLCGEESVVDLVQKIAAETGDECIVKRYERLSPLVVAEKSLEGDLSRIRRGDCLVTFSRSNIFAFKRAIEEQTGLRVAVAYGGLPPEVREEQARAFNAGEYDVLVASDAVGMGLNLKIRRIVFESLHKWDGTAEITLPIPQIKQIAGRAGRFGVHTSVSPSAAPDLDAPLSPSPSSSTPAAAASTDETLGAATTLDAQDLPLLRSAMATPTIQVTRASLSAPISSFRSLWALMAPSTPLSRVFSLSKAITSSKPHYQPSGTDSLGVTSDLIAHVGPLTFNERYTFGSAPVNTRDGKVVEALIEWAGDFAKGEKVTMARWGAEKGVFAALDNAATVESVRSSAVGGSGPALTKRQSSSLYTPAALQSLESYHRCLTLYLWLSYRLSSIFSDQQGARELRRRVEKAIERALEGIRFERVSRGEGARRNKARFASTAGVEGEGEGFEEVLKWFGRGGRR